MNPKPPGRVITFYSYKGGTGRSMALANVAWVLAAAGKRVLMIDWDLEAPGLHRYFKPFLIDHELSGSDGLMDVIDGYTCEAIKPLDSSAALADDWWLPLADIGDQVLSIDFDHFPAGGSIDLLPAGRQTPTYAVKVNAFNWQNFYERLGGGGFLDAMMAGARARYDYVLIDSRTGVSDTAGICTAQMPDTLVACFTYNNQGIKGTAAVAASARAQQAALAVKREQQAQVATEPGVVRDSPRPYRIFPIPMRVVDGETERLALRQAFARDMFGSMLDGEAAADKARYWSRVEVPHQIFYAYEEVLAPFKDDPHDPKQVLSAFVRIVHYLTDGEVADYKLPLEPALRQAYLEAYAETPQTAAMRQASAEASKESEEQALVRRADSLLLGLATAERALARSVLCRLVRIGKDDEGGRNHPIQVPVGDIVDEQRAVLSLLAHGALLTIGTGTRASASASRAVTPEQMVGLADDRLVTQWPTMLEWLAEDRDFLLWRQQLRDYRIDWARTKEPAALLSGSLLGEARLWALKRSVDLNLAEHEFINASTLAAKPPRVFSSMKLRVFGTVVMVLVVCLLGIFAFISKIDEHALLSAAAQRSAEVVKVPDLVGGSSADAQKIAQSLGLALVMVDAATKTEQAFVDGVVVGQDANAAGRSLRITVATKTIDVPLLIGLSLDAASSLLQKSGLKLVEGAPLARTDAKVQAGMVGVQSPDPGAQVAPNTTVSVRIAEAGVVAIGDALHGFKVAIFYYDEDRRGGVLAGEIEAQLRKFKFAGPIDKRASSAQFMTDVYPPKTVEVRYDGQGSEDQAAAVLQSIVEQVPDIGRVRKFPVLTTTPKYISVFIPRTP